MHVALLRFDTGEDKEWGEGRENGEERREKGGEGRRCKGARHGASESSERRDEST